MPNQIGDRPDRAMARLLRDHYLSFKEIFLESGKQQDSIAVWLVGMSTGSIALIISQFGKLSPNLYAALKWSVGFLTVTIILGLLFRIFHLLMQNKDRHYLSWIVVWLAEYSRSSTEPLFELPEDADAGFIALCLYYHMGIDMDPDFLRTIEAENDVEYWKSKYEKHTILHRNLEEATEELEKQMVKEFSTFVAELEGLSSEKKMDNKSKGIRKRRLRTACNWLYILMSVSFAISVLIISCGFITNDSKVNLPLSATNQKTVAPSEQVQTTQTDKPD